MLGMAGVILLMFIMLIVTMAKNSSTRKKYKKFMAGENGKNLEKEEAQTEEQADEEVCFRCDQDGFQVCQERVRKGSQEVLCNTGCACYHHSSCVCLHHHDFQFYRFKQRFHPRYLCGAGL